MLIPLMVTESHVEVQCVAEERAASVFKAEVVALGKCLVSVCRRLLSLMKGDRGGPVEGLRGRQHLSPKAL
jgi:hypothetical protein